MEVYRKYDLANTFTFVTSLMLLCGALGLSGYLFHKIGFIMAISTYLIIVGVAILSQEIRFRFFKWLLK